jgi:hypothetical protein
MTGEITLRGQVLPIGGVREKVLAAHRAGIRDVILPDRNRKDEPEIPPAARADMRLHFVKHIREVLEIVLLAAEPWQGQASPSWLTFTVQPRWVHANDSADTSASLTRRTKIGFPLPSTRTITSPPLLASSGCA